MTSEIIIDWTAFITASMTLRTLAVIFGATLLIHVWCMATKISPKTPWSLAILLGVNAASAGFVIIAAIAGNLAILAQSAIVTLGADTLRQLWLWHHGMHVSDFIEKTYG